MFSIKENIKKWSITCLFSLVGVSLLGQSMDLPILPLPKVAIAAETSPEKAVYGKLTFEWKGTNPSLHKAVVSEFDQFVVTASGTALEVHCEKVTSVKTLGNLLKTLELDEKLAERVGTEGYIVAGGQDQYRVIAGGDAGILYGLQTIKQLLRSGHRGEVKVVDWPDFPTRIFFDDISRGPISTVEFVKEQIRHLSEMKYNGLTFYVEHVLQPLSHPDFAPVNGKFTMEDVREICNYAREYQMEVIGSFQCFGHFENILVVEKYGSLGDTPSMIAPLNPDARNFLQSVLGELADAFSSDYFNINCDEVWDLGKGKSAEYVAKIGADRFFADHILFLHQTLKAKGKKVMMWGDIIMKYPHLIDQLPGDMVYLTWNYGGKNYEPWLQPFRDRKSRFMVCPGILNSNRLFPDLNMTRENIQFITDGYNSGALGVMYTAWDDSSFHNFISTMYGVALAAEYSWNASRSTDLLSFEKRYCILRFGKEDPGFLRTLDELMKFGGIGITYEMNDRVFYERFTPEPGRYFNLNKEEIGKARHILNAVLQAASEVETDRDHPEIKALLYAIKQYQFIVQSREVLSQVSDYYKESLRLAGAEKYKARSLLLNAVTEMNRLEELTLWLKNQFTEIWLSENQSYCLARGLELYGEKFDQIEHVKTILLESIDQIDRGELPGSIDAVGLEVREINSNYFPCWLFCGSFANGEMDGHYLEYAGGEAGADPIPGERFTYGEQEYKWTRYVSDNGFVMDFNRAYSSVNNGIAYATAVLYAEEETEIEILLGTSGESQLFCNGKEVGRSDKENEFVADKYRWKVILNPGANRLILKSRQLVNEWKFSFRIDGKVVKSHKQKYYLY